MINRGMGVAVALLVGLAACGGGDAEPEATDTALPEAAPPVAAADNVQYPEGVTSEMATQGEQLFGTICIACHGVGGTGVAALGPNLTDDTWLNIDGSYEQMVNVITTGVPQPKEHSGPMLPMGGGNFTEEQIRQLAAYVYRISHS